MSYRGACCCERRGLAGLGVSEAEFLGARDNLIGFINRTNARIAGLADTPAVAAIRRKMAAAEQWFKAAIERYYAGDAGDAMQSILVSYRNVHEASQAIGALRPEDRIAAAAEARAREGASISYQVRQTLSSGPAILTEPIASVVEAVSPAAAQAVRSSGWLLPIGAGLLVFLLLRR